MRGPAKAVTGLGDFAGESGEGDPAAIVFARVAQLDSAVSSEETGHWFESNREHQKVWPGGRRGCSGLSIHALSNAGSNPVRVANFFVVFGKLVKPLLSHSSHRGFDPRTPRQS